MRRVRRAGLAAAIMAAGLAGPDVLGYGWLRFAVAIGCIVALFVLVLDLAGDDGR